MKTIISLTICVLLFSTAAFAQSKSTSKITVKPAGLGRLTISKGSVRRVINLKKEIAGCAYVAAEFKKSLDKKGCSASPATLTLGDSVTKNKINYVIISAVAMGGCNVCGRCGAAESTTLIWLALDASLKETARQSVVVEDCSENIEIISTDSFIPRGTDIYDLKFTGDVFKIEFEKTVFSDDDKAGYYYHMAEYDRSKPEKGFVVKTERRRETSTN